MASGNRTLGKFILDGIPPAPRGVPQIEVTFDIDANGIMSVHAKDNATNKEQSIRIEGSGGLAQEEIERMVQDAEEHAAEDTARRESVEKHNQLDGMIYQAEKTLGDDGGKIADADQQSVRAAVEEAKKVLESDDPAKLEAARQRLEQELHRVAEALYKAQAAETAPGSEGSGGPEGSTGGGDGDVVDAEYTEEKGDG